jgi:hypothetical protein
MGFLERWLVSGRPVEPRAPAVRQPPRETASAPTVHAAT